MTMVLDRVDSQHKLTSTIAANFNADGGRARLLIPHDVSDESVTCRRRSNNDTNQH